MRVNAVAIGPETTVTRGGRRACVLATTILAVAGLAALVTVTPVASAGWGAGFCTNAGNGAELDFYNDWGPNAYVGVSVPVPGIPKVSLSHGAHQGACG